MGAETTCTITIGRKTSTGKALLETDALLFRGDGVKLSIPYCDVIEVSASGGHLRVIHAGGVATFDVGAVAPRWAKKISSPPTRADKLGVKAGQIVLLVGLTDAHFIEELQSRGARITRSGSPDVIFCLVE